MSGRAAQRRPGSRRPDRRKDERGGVALMVAVLTSLLIGVASFAIDLGMARVGVRDMQAMADVVALDMARHLDGRSRSEILADPEWDQSMAETMARNDGTIGVAGTLDVAAEPGVFNAVTRVVDTASTETPDAVLVTATTSVDYIFRDGGNTLTRTAVAQASKTACFQLGSYAARFRSGDSALLNTLLGPMNELIRPQANLDVLSYQGIANAAVSLNELAATSDVGTVDELLTGTVTAGQLIRASITALQRQNPTNTVAVTALGRILNGQANLTTSLRLTDVVAIAPTDTAAADTRLNVLDLVTGSILLADGEHAVNVPNLSAGTGNLSPVSASLKVIQKPQPACGAEVARTSQLKGDVLMKLQLPTINGITGVQGVVQTPEAAVRLIVDLGNATGQLGAGGPTCDPDTIPVDVASQLSVLKLSTSLRFKAAKLNVLGLGQVDVTFDQTAVAEVPMPPASQAVTLQVPPNDNTPVSVGSSAPLGNFQVAGVATNISATINVLGLPVPLLGGDLDLVRAALVGVTNQLAVNASVIGPLNHLVGSVNGLLAPLRTLLGLQVSGADVFAVGRPTCNGSSLRG